MTRNREQKLEPKKSYLLQNNVSIAGISQVFSISSPSKASKPHPWMKWAIMLALGLAGALAVSRAQTPASAGDSTPSAPASKDAPALNVDASYILDSHDEFSVDVLRHSEYSGSFNVPSDGIITFPGIATLDVKGKSLSELQALLATKLLERLKKPEVFVTLRRQRPRLVYLIGFVGAAAPYNIEPNWRISEALAAAGGIKIRPERAKAFLFRAGKPEQSIDLSAILQNGDPKANFALEPGDTISVQEVNTIRVFLAGQVSKPGDYDLENGLGVVQALAQAGGYNSSAALTKAIIYRKDQAIPVNLYKAMVLTDRSADVRLEQNDVLLIPPDIRRVALMGEVDKPGWYGMTEGKEMRLSDAISLTGNVTKRGLTTRIYIIRAENGKITRTPYNFQDYLKKGNPAGNPLLQDSDVIYVQETKRVDWGSILGGLASLTFFKGL